jgi:hypothetical protein
LEDEQQDPAPSNYTTGLEELSNLAQLKDIKLTMEFIQALDGASLDKEDSRLDADTLHRLRNLPTSCVDLTDPDLHLGLDLFLASIKSSQDTYTMSRDAIIRRHPDDDIPTYDQMKRRIAEITGVVPIMDDMCRNSCIAFTGPLAKLDACSECGEPRLDPVTKKALQHLYTIPPGPQLQAQWRDVESAQRMCYRSPRRSLPSCRRMMEFSLSFPTFYSSAYLEAVRCGHINDNNMVLMLSIDGAQLYEHKESTC